MALLFPLSSVARPWGERRADLLCKDVRRRLFLRNTLLGLVRHALQSPNFCGRRSLRGRAVTRPGWTPFIWPSAAQRSDLDRVFRRCRESGPPPRRSGQEALCELLKVEVLEHDVDSSGVGPFCWEKLKLPRGSWAVVPRAIEDIAPPDVAQWFQRPGQFRFSREQARQVANDSPVPAPYWDVRLAADASLRRRFFSALREQGLLTHRRKVYSLPLLCSNRVVGDSSHTSSARRLAMLYLAHAILVSEPFVVVALQEVPVS